MIKSILIVGCGSFVGGALRFLISTLMKNECASSFPIGTLIVNISGCFLIGIIYGFLFAIAQLRIRYAFCLLPVFAVDLLPFLRLLMRACKCSRWGMWVVLLAMFRQVLY